MGLLKSSNMVRIPLEKLNSTCNINPTQPPKFLFDGDPNTQYNPNDPSWNSILTPVETALRADEFQTCIPRQMKFLKRNNNDLETKLYFVLKGTGEKVLIYTFTANGYKDTEYWVFDIPAQYQVDVKRIIFEAPNGGPLYPEDFQLWGDFTERVFTIYPGPKTPLTKLFRVVLKPYDICFNAAPNKLALFLNSGVTGCRIYDDDYLVRDEVTKELIFDDQRRWFQQDHLRLLKEKAGWEVHVCYLDSPFYPFPTGEARYNPDTYLPLGKIAYEFIKNAKLKTPDYLDEMEIENELQRDWQGLEKFTDGRAHGVLMSVCFDGHKGKYSNCGVKQADPSKKYVMPGLAASNPNFYFQILDWAEENRGRRPDGFIDFPADVVSFHWYPGLGGQYSRENIVGGFPPEISGYRELKKFVDEIRKNTPFVEINLGEWGYNVNKDAPLNAPAFGQYDAEQTRGMWAIRCLLMFAELGINTAEYYKSSQDANWLDASPGQFDTMAEFRDNEDGTNQPPPPGVIAPFYYPDATYTRLIVGDYKRQLCDLFKKGFVFDSRLTALTDPVQVLKFKKDGAELYFLCTVETYTTYDIFNGNGDKVGQRPIFTEVSNTYTLNVKGKLYKFKDRSDIMDVTDFAGGSITCNSKPVCVLVDNTTPPPAPAPTSRQVDRGYFKDPDTLRNQYWTMWKDDKGALTVKKTNSKYQ